MELDDLAHDIVCDRIVRDGDQAPEEGGLKDLSISRTTFNWGIPVPGNPKHVIYVWFDALTNYITGAGFPDEPERFAGIWPADIHLVGKDILRFHAVFWPAFLMSAKIPLPRTVFAHGWWTVEGEKMSKSLGNVVDPYQMAEEFGADVFRYFLLREIPFGQDGDFSKSAIVSRVNGDLANGLGNLVSRTLGMLERYRGGIIPAPAESGSSESNIAEALRSLIGEVDGAMNEIAFHKALGAIWEFIALVNKYVDDEAPWTLAKEKKDERLDTVLWTISRSIGVVSILISPFMPSSAEEIWRRLGSPKPFSSLRLADAGDPELISPGQASYKGTGLFPRYEEKS